MKYLLLFDIDGTILLMKKRISRLVFSQMLKLMFGKDVPVSAMPNFAGMTDLQILRKIAENTNIDFIDINNSLEDIWLSLADVFAPYCTPQYIDLMPGIIELIERISLMPEIQLGLLTGNFKKHAYLKLKSYNIDHFFPVGAFGCDHENRNILPPLAINRANEYAGQEIYNISNTLIIGDTPRDIECAKINNIPVLAVATGPFSKIDLSNYAPEIILDDLSDLDKSLDSIFRLLKLP